MNDIPPTENLQIWFVGTQNLDKEIQMFLDLNMWYLRKLLYIMDSMGKMKT